MTKYKTIELVIDTNLTNEEILKIFNNETPNLNSLSIELLEIRVVGSANSIIKGINYKNDNVWKKWQIKWNS